MLEDRERERLVALIHSYKISLRRFDQLLQRTDTLATKELLLQMRQSLFAARDNCQTLLDYRWAKPRAKRR